jgi:ATP phosphoribosyltransferase
MLTIALPKGRLFDQAQEHFAKRGIRFTFEERKLIAHDDKGLLEIFLVKNADLPTYVNSGIAGLGICGDDVLFETAFPFYELMTLPFGSTKMCIAGKKNDDSWKNEALLKIATKFPRFTKEYFHKRNIPVELIKLGGSVELAPVLGLTPLIVDLVETGNTLKAHDLAVFDVLTEIKVKLVVNPSYYKINFNKIAEFVDIIKV